MVWIVTPQFAPADAVYTREAEYARLKGGARLKAEYGASLLLKATNLGTNGGNRKDGQVVFTPRVKWGGLYWLTIHYTSAAPDRTLTLSVNGGTAQTVACPGMYGDRPMQTRVQIDLKPGKNTLAFGCADWYAPDLDKITIAAYSAYAPTMDGGARGDVQKTCTLGDYKITFKSGFYSIQKGERVLIEDARVAYGNGTMCPNLSQLATTETKEGITALYTDDTVAWNHYGKEDFDENITTVVQKFWLEGDALLTNVMLEVPDGTATNWISPLHTQSANSLTGGTSWVSVPYDNDDYSYYKTLPSGSSLGYSSEVTALINKDDQSGVVIGSVTHDTWKTGISWSQKDGAIERFTVFGGTAGEETRDSAPHGTVSGKTVTSPTIFIGAFDYWQDALAAYGKANAAEAKPLAWAGNAPVGWNSWGAMQFDITKNKVQAVSDYLHDTFAEVWQQSEDDVVYVNLDAGGLDELGVESDWRDFVEYCAKNGQKVGVYATPWACWTKEQDMVGKPLYDALLRDADGNILPAWDGALAYDPTHPLVWERIEKQLQSFLDVGIAYIKLDFMSHGAMEGKHYLPEIQTGTQAYNYGMKKIADKVADKMFINLSIAPIFPYQYAHGRRLACDTYSSSTDTRYMLNSLSYGFWTQELYACPDPDHIVLWGRDGNASENEARARATSGLLAASFLTGDDFSGPAGDAETAFRRFADLLGNEEILRLARSRTVFAPAWTPHVHSDAANIYTAEIDGKRYWAVINFSGNPEQFTLPLPTHTQSVRELWSGEVLDVSQSSIVTLQPFDGRVYVEQ
jgi:alpha-galactosidase